MTHKSNDEEKVDESESNQDIHPNVEDIAPDTIHQIWIQGEEHLKETRPHFWKHIQKFVKVHQGRHHLWSEDEILSLINREYPELLETFTSYPHFILRVDLAKYIIMHHYGGFSMYNSPLSLHQSQYL